MYCQKCGSNLKEDAIFCENCGSRVLEQNLNQNINPNIMGYQNSNNQNNQTTNFNQQLNSNIAGLQNQNVQYVQSQRTNNQYQQSQGVNSQYQQFVQNNNQGIMYQNNINDNELIDIYIGKNADKLKNGKFSICTLLFGVFYIFYRKMWLLGIIWYIGSIIVSSYLPSFYLIISLVLNIIMAINFKKWYLQHAKENVEKIKQENAGASSYKLVEICKRKGGTSLIILILPIILFFIISSIVAIPQILGVLNNATEAAAEDSSYGVIKSATTYIEEFELKNNGLFPSQNLEFECEGQSCKLITNLSFYNTDGLTEFSYKGLEINSGKVIIDSSKNVYIKDLIIGRYTCNINNYDSVICEK